MKLGYASNVLLILTMQLTGFSLAGLCCRYLVWLASMVWPQNLIVCTLLNILYAEVEDARGAVTRFKFFCYVVVGWFFWFFLPGTSRSPTGARMSIRVLLTPACAQAICSRHCQRSRTCAGSSLWTSSSPSSLVSLGALGWVS